MAAAFRIFTRRRRPGGWALTLTLTVAGALLSILTGIPAASAKPVGGGAWHLKPIFFPSDWQPTLAPDTLTSVSCASAISCMAVGQYYNGNEYAPLIEQWNGVGWNPVTAPAPTPHISKHYDYDLIRVSCPSASWCVAVGDVDVYGKPTKTFTNGVRSYPYIAVYNGSGWNAVSAAAVKLDDGTGSLDEVACLKVKQCIVVSFDYGRNRRREGTFRFDGRNWKRLGSTPPSYVTELSCAKLTYCQAALGTTQVASWNGKKWSVKTVDKKKTIADIDCPATRRCIAVGGATGPFETTTHSELWDGHKWYAIPESRDHAKGLSVVSCPTTKSCYTAGGYYRPYIAGWDRASGKWAVTRPAIPSGYYTVRMSALDCPTATFCMGVGELDPNSISTPDALTSWEFIG
jgi:hypothetical protein